jgi:CRISPR-associated protein Cas5h
MVELIAFDVWADYANFRRGYTTTSNLTYPFPTRTNIAGLIAGMLGFQQNSYHEIFGEENSLIGCRILNPIKKINFNQNMMNTKEGFNYYDIKKNPRVRVYGELLKDVKYRIYVSLSDHDLLLRLFNNLKEHKCVYTPYLGNSTCICDFGLAYDEVFDVNPEHAGVDGVPVDSVILKHEDNLILEPGKKYASIKNTGYMDDNRVVTKWLEYYYLENPDTLLLKNDIYYSVGGENIVLY